MTRAGAVALLAVLVLVSSFSAATSQQQPVAPRTVLSTLKAGQSVIVKESGDRYEISTMDLGTPLTHTVVEVGDDFCVVRDVAGVRETWIPVYSVKAVVHVRTKPRR